MSSLTTTKTDKFTSNYTWHIRNTNEWMKLLIEKNCTEIKSEEHVFEEFPNIKWYLSISRSDNTLSFLVNTFRDKVDSDKNSYFEYKVSAQMRRGKHRAYWLYYESKQDKLPFYKSTFSKTMGELPSVNKYLNGDDFEVVLIYDLFITNTVTITKPVISEKKPQLLLIEDLRNLLNIGNYYDVTLDIAGKEYKVHKAILSARSPFFANFFKMNSAIKTYAIDLEVSKTVSEAFLNFIYTGDYENIENINDVLKIFALADIYQVEDLKEIYECFLETRVTTENAAVLFCYALKYNSTHGLKKRAFEVLQAHYKEMGVNIPQNMIDKSIEVLEEYIDSEIRIIEMDLQEMNINEE
ncbi:hypothetical protein PVAND_003662 [Polypedilum vanderplanki]|uniref:BTB domain-containing protein n=1 Tax=Polypedilum vanderplanki TaxID=319348 RepID=A0A9J6BUQ8_POLVA|nr:hypothetical protein PVAND_003662 [Polypedilum vanderplanki]